MYLKPASERGLSIENGPGIQREAEAARPDVDGFDVYLLADPLISVPLSRSVQRLILERPDTSKILARRAL